MRWVSDWNTIILIYQHCRKTERHKQNQKSRLADAVLKMYKNKIVTLNRAREIMEEDTVPGDDVYYEPSKNNGNGEQDDTETGFYPEEAPPVDGEEESQSYRKSGIRMKEFTGKPIVK